MAEVKTFTAEEVAEHKSRDDIWFAIHGKVYDVTDFLDEHPGGEEVRFLICFSRSFSVLYGDAMFGARCVRAHVYVLRGCAYLHMRL